VAEVREDVTLARRGHDLRGPSYPLACTLHHQTAQREPDAGVGAATMVTLPMSEARRCSGYVGPNGLRARLTAVPLPPIRGSVAEKLR
jgi:hypothetical protein